MAIGPGLDPPAGRKLIGLKMACIACVPLLLAVIA